jgi:hypothetical protein
VPVPSTHPAHPVPYGLSPRASVLYCTSNPAGRSSGQRKSPVLFLLPSQGWRGTRCRDARAGFTTPSDWARPVWSGQWFCTYEGTGTVPGTSCTACLTQGSFAQEEQAVPVQQPGAAATCRWRSAPAEWETEARRGVDRPSITLPGPRDRRDRKGARGPALRPGLCFSGCPGRRGQHLSCSTARGCPVPSSRSTKVNKVAVAGIIRQVEFPVGPRCLGRNGTPPPLFGWGRRTHVRDVSCIGSRSRSVAATGACASSLGAVSCRVQQQES